MEPITQVAAAVTIASGCIATAIAVGGVSAKVIMRLIHNREIIVHRFNDLLLHLHETAPDVYGPGFFYKKLHKYMKHGAIAVDRMTKRHLKQFFKLIHPTNVAKTLRALSTVVKDYENVFLECAACQEHIGMHGAIAGASIIASQVMDIADVFNSCVNDMKGTVAFDVIANVFDRGHAPIPFGEHGDKTINATLSAFVVFLGSLISFDRVASQFSDTCTLGELPDGRRRDFSLWMGSGENDGVMRHTLKRLRNEIRDLLADEKLPTIGGKKKRETLEYESSSSSACDADGTSVSGPTAPPQAKKHRPDDKARSDILSKLVKKVGYGKKMNDGELDDLLNPPTDEKTGIIELE